MLVHPVCKLLWKYSCVLHLYSHNTPTATGSINPKRQPVLVHYLETWTELAVNLECDREMNRAARCDVGGYHASSNLSRRHSSICSHFPQRDIAPLFQKSMCKRLLRHVRVIHRRSAVRRRLRRVFQICELIFATWSTLIGWRSRRLAFWRYPCVLPSSNGLTPYNR